MAHSDSLRVRNTSWRHNLGQGRLDKTVFTTELAEDGVKRPLENSIYRPLF